MKVICDFVFIYVAYLLAPARTQHNLRLLQRSEFKAMHFGTLTLMITWWSSKVISFSDIIQAIPLYLIRFNYVSTQNVHRPCCLTHIRTR